MLNTSNFSKSVQLLTIYLKILRSYMPKRQSEYDAHRSASMPKRA